MRPGSAKLMNVDISWHAQIKQLRHTHTLMQLSAIVGKAPHTIANYCQDNQLSYRYDADLRQELYGSFIQFCLDHTAIDARCVSSVSCFAKDRLQRGAIIAAAFQVTGILSCTPHRGTKHNYWRFPIVNPQEVAYARQKGADLIKLLTNGFTATEIGARLLTGRRKVA